MSDSSGSGGARTSILEILVAGNRARTLLLVLLLLMVQGAFAEEVCIFEKTWRLYGGESGTPASDVAIDAVGNVYVTEPAQNRVAEYSPEGSRTMYWDLRDTESGKSAIPTGIAVDASRTVYFTDRENNTVQKMTLWGKVVWGSEGTGTGQFSHPTGIAVDSSGNVYVADTGNNRIQKFHSSGTWLLQWGSYGTSDGAFNAPGGIAVDSSGQVYVADTGNSRVQKFTSDGTFLTKWGTPGTGTGQFQAPNSIAVDSWGNVYVADLTTRVQKFNPTGEYFTTCNTSGSTYDIAIDPSGTMYAVWQSGPAWKIGVSRIPSAVPPQTTVKRPTFAVATRQTTIIPTTPSVTPTVPAALQNSAPTSPPPAQPATTLASDNTSPVPGPSPAVTHVADDTAGTGATGNRTGGDPAVTDMPGGIFERLSAFIRDLFR